MRKNAIHASRGDRIFDTVNIILLLAVFLVVAYPLYFVVCASISDPNAVASGEVIFGPVDVTLEGYEKILDYDQIWIGYRNTIFYAVSGMVLSLLLTIALAYPLSRKDFKLRGPIMVMITITMFFSGGMIPTYLVVSDLALLNTVWAVLLPSAITASHVIIVRTYFQSIPKDLTEAAFIDGCTNFQTFLHVVLPLSKAVIAVIALYVSSSLWNRYFEPMLYLSDRNLYPLQLFLRQILIQNDLEGADISAATIQEQQYISELIKYGVIIVSTLPMMLAYPFIQKYFVKGVMIGSIKG